MKLAVYGLGRLGLPLLNVLQHSGFDVVGCDPKFINDSHWKGDPPETNEPGVVWRVKPVLASCALPADVNFIVVPTPSLDKGDHRGGFDSYQVEVALRHISNVNEAKLAEVKPIAVIVSTVSPGTCEQLQTNFPELRILYNPTFIALGEVVKGLTEPNLLLVGGESDGRMEVLQIWSRVFHLFVAGKRPYCHAGSFTEIELIKLSVNAALGTKISLANSLGRLFKAYGVDPAAVNIVGRDPRIGTDYFMPGSPIAGPCVPPETLIQTEDGLRPISSILAGEKVFGHDGSLHQVVEVMQRPYSGELVEICPGGFAAQSIWMTPEHPVFSDFRNQGLRRTEYSTTVRGKQTIRKQQSDRSIFLGEFIESKQLQSGDFTYYPIPSVAKYFPKPLVLKGYHRIEDLIIDQNPDFFRFLGWYLSEGHLDKGVIGFTLAADEKDYAADITELSAILFSRKINNVPKGENAQRLKMNCSALSLWIDEYLGHGAANKRVPMGWLGLPELCLIDLLRGIWYGDGSCSDDVFTFASTSLQLWNFSRLALLKLGVPVRTGVYRAHVGRDGTKHAKSYWIKMSNPVFYRRMNTILPSLAIEGRHSLRVNHWISEAGMVSSIRKVNTASYNGVVWNLAVEDSESYMTGSLALHNCLPRDNRALHTAALKVDVHMPLAVATDRVNHQLIDDLFDEAAARRPTTVGILGMSYKYGVDIDTGSAGASLRDRLQSSGVECFTHDYSWPAPDLDKVLKADVVVVTQKEYGHLIAHCLEGTMIIKIWS